MHTYTPETLQEPVQASPFAALRVTGIVRFTLGAPLSSAFPVLEAGKTQFSPFAVLITTKKQGLSNKNAWR